MPTNVLRQRSIKPSGAVGSRSAPEEPRIALLTTDRVAIRLRLLPTPTADRIWAALPIRSTVEFRGTELFFEVPVASGRERGARTIVLPRDIAFVPDREVVAFVVGPTPRSRKGELRLWSPSNIWAEALDDVAVLAAIVPGSRIELVRVGPDTGVAG